MLQSLEAGQVTWGQGKDRETLGEEKPLNTPLSHFGILSELNKQHLKTSASSCLMWSAWVFSSSTAFLSLGICSDTFLSLSSPVRLPVSLYPSPSGPSLAGSAGGCGLLLLCQNNALFGGSCRRGDRSCQFPWLGQFWWGTR